MKYFIPSWYREDIWWKDRTYPFYKSLNISEFDDMISLIQMHKKVSREFMVLNLCYASSFRLFLHRNFIYGINYWSVFDDIQGFKDINTHIMDYRQFNWPDGTEFIYTPYLIKAYISKDDYTNIYFDQYGYLIRMENYKKSIKEKRYVFDDRGYLSSVVTYNDLEQPVLIEFMTISGDCILKEEVQTGKVLVEKKYHSEFDQIIYKNMEYLIAERFRKYITKYESSDDIVIASAENRHREIIENVIPYHQLCYSVFNKRNRHLKEIENYNSQYLIVDTLENEKQMNNIESGQRNFDLLRITPFDTEYLPNQSNQYFTDYIGVVIDSLSIEVLELLIENLKRYVSHDEKFKIILLTQQGLKSIPERIINSIEAFNTKDKEINEEELIFESEEIDEDQIMIEHIPHEFNIKKLLNKVRIIIDLAYEPDLFIQISAVSAGIPQINMRQTDYVQHLKNGYILENLNLLDESLDYFLKKLQNWNFSHAYSLQLVQEYNSDSIVQRLDHFLGRGIEKHETL